VDIDGIIAGYLIMSFVVIGKVGTTEGIGETTETGVLKADTTAHVMGDTIELSVETKDKVTGKTKWNVVARDKTTDKIDKVREWSDIKVVLDSNIKVLLDSNLLLVVAEVKVIRTT